MEQSPVSRGGQRQARCALCVLSCLLLMLGLLLPHLLSPLRPASHCYRILQATGGDPDKLQELEKLLQTLTEQSGVINDVTPGTTSLGAGVGPADNKPDTATVRGPSHPPEPGAATPEMTSSSKGADGPVQDMDRRSFSPRGRGKNACASEYDDVITDVLVTSDRQVVASLYYGKSLVVDSRSGVEAVSLQCHPKALGELPGPVIAVTCYHTPLILLVDLSTPTHPVRPIPTEKLYRHVVYNPRTKTLLVSFRSVYTRDNYITEPASGLDVISTKGKFIRTVVDPQGKRLVTVMSLRAINDDVLVADGAGRVLRVTVAKGREPELTVVTEVTHPLQAVADKASNVFLATKGAVTLKGQDGSSRRLVVVVEEEEEGFVIDNIAVCKDRLLVVTLNSYRRQSRLTQYLII